MSTTTLAHVARLHYLRRLSKLEIAERLGISRFKVARMLEQAWEEGVVSIRIADTVAVDDELSQRLEQAYGLDSVLVVAPEEIARATASLLPTLLGPDDVLGVAWGTTLSQIAEELPSFTDGLPVVQICGAIAGLGPGASPGEVAVRFAERVGGPLYSLPVPAITPGSARKVLLQDPTVRPTVEMFDRVTTALVGIGSRPGGQGHLLVHVFDGAGAVREELDAIALSLDQLRSTRVVAAAGGEGKQRAVVGALRSGLLNVLVTDTATAEAALA